MSAEKQLSEGMATSLIRKRLLREKQVSKGPPTHRVDHVHLIRIIARGYFYTRIRGGGESCGKRLQLPSRALTAAIQEYMFYT